MQWLEYSAVEPQQNEAQAVNVLADVKTLAKLIPIAPRLIPTSEGPPAPEYEWYGRIGQRLVMIETLADLDVATGIAIWTAYISADRGGDWKILHELRGLPDCIFLSRPLWIQSRTRRSDHAVYRPHERGWNDAIYLAASRAEAEALIDHLKTDHFNANCFIDELEPQGEWGIIRNVDGREQVIGAYPLPNETLRVACDMSLRAGDSRPLVVRDLQQGGASSRYEVLNGRVVSDSRLR